MGRKSGAATPATPGTQRTRGSQLCGLPKSPIPPATDTDSAIRSPSGFEGSQIPALIQ